MDKNSKQIQENIAKNVLDFFFICTSSFLVATSKIYIFFRRNQKKIDILHVKLLKTTNNAFFIVNVLE